MDYTDMRYAGIDIGSRTIELVVIDREGAVIDSHQIDSGFDPTRQAQLLIDRADYDGITATGYGRNLFEIAYDAPTVTEIKAHATAVSRLFPKANGVLDIGGQDSKAISLSESGRIKKFEMNDRCAAGTGKFLEIMARSLGYTIDSFGEEALQAKKELAISSMCTVFAESEVTSLIARGEDRREIAKGLHDGVVRRAIAMVKRVVGTGDIVFTGGVAKNTCIVKLLENKLECGVSIPENPQEMGAYGAALLTQQADGK